MARPATPEQQARYNDNPRRCIDCGEEPSAGRPRCDDCHSRWVYRANRGAVG